MSTMRSINVYVLEGGKYVMKSKNEHLAGRPALTTRSDFDDGSQPSQKNTVQGDMVASLVRQRPALPPDLTNSAVMGRRSDYLPKYFTSRKVSVHNDLEHDSPNVIRVETDVYHTPIKPPTLPFSLMQPDTLSQHPADVEDGVYSPRDNHTVYETDRDVLRAKDREIANLTKRIQQLVSTNRDLSDRITYSERHSLESKNFQEMVWYRKTIGERTAELEALRVAHTECQEANREQLSKIGVLEKAHQQLCTEVLQLRGQVLSQQDVMMLCSSTDVFSSNKRVNPALAVITKLQNEIERLQSSLNLLEGMLEDGQLNEDSADEIYRFRKQLEWQRELVRNYLAGFERKEALHNLLLCLVEKTKAENRLTQKLRNEVRVKEAIIRDMTQLIERLSNELALTSSRKRQPDARPACHEPRNSRLSRIESGSPSREDYTAEAKKINYVLLSGKLSQAEVRKQSLQSQVFSQQAELDYKVSQLAQIKSFQTSQATHIQRTRQLESQVGQLRDSLQRLEGQLQKEQSEIEKSSEELRQLGTRPTLTERGSRQRSLEAPVSIHQLQQSLETIRKILLVDDFHQWLVQVQGKTHWSKLKPQHNFDSSGLNHKCGDRPPMLSSFVLQAPIIINAANRLLLGLAFHQRSISAAWLSIKQSVYGTRQREFQVIENKLEMDPAGGNCFVEATKENTQALARHSEILIMSVFYKKKGLLADSGRLLALTDRYLVYYKDETKSKVKRICQMTFQCKFEILRELSRVRIDNMQDTRTPGVPIGIRFEKNGFDPMELYCASAPTLQLWKDHLEKMMNQRGFHSLFKPIKKIGKGNFASVYLAERLEDHKMVAVKAFSKESVYAQEKGRQSLINEIKLLRKLNQPNIMKMFGVYESDNSIYMTLELLEGGQLFSKIQSKHVFTPDEVKQIMRGLILGLQHMHSKRIMHRDLKPQNIMLRSNGSCEPVIADFGLATWADEPEYLFVRCGTPGYVAPQIINIRDMKTKSDPICDVFSAGLVFHILLLGKSVFPGKNYNDVLNQNRACDFFLDAAQYQFINRAAHHLLKGMLEKDPRKRISAHQALKHPYFTEMEIERPMSPQLFVYAETPLKVIEENKPQFSWPSHRVSVFTNKDDSTVLKNITNGDINRVGLKYAPSNYTSFYPNQQRHFSNDVHHREKS